MCGGFDARARELLGPTWLEEGAPFMSSVHVHKIAQRALSDCFEQLGQLAESGRFKVAGEKYGPVMPAEVSRIEIDAVLNYAEDVIECARAQLGYLPHSRYRLNAQVAFMLEGERIIGRVEGSTKEGRRVVCTRGSRAVPSRRYEVWEAELHTPDELEGEAAAAVVESNPSLPVPPGEADYVAEVTP